MGVGTCTQPTPYFNIMTPKLHIDFETYSSVDLPKAGAYKYINSADFEALLMAYAYNDEPVQIVDFAQNEQPDEKFFTLLFDPFVEKHAHNATFERLVCTRIGWDVPLDEWRCSQATAAYCGLPLPLDKVSEALNLKNAKLKSGTMLINYFSKPCKPTKANNQRKRNLPHHDLERWELFKTYCIGDVEAEREIDTILSMYPIPERERALYIIDQKINDKGVRISPELAQKALEIDKEYSKEITAKLKRITGLDNPNSSAQLTGWLSHAMQTEIKSIAKDQIPIYEALTSDRAVLDVLNLRKKSSKTSIKKYNAMQSCMMDDQRGRGMLKYYGAMRTGRWAGRLVQLHNLPQNHIQPLTEIRNMVLDGDYELIAMLYDNVSQVLSELIRTAFVPSKGNKFVVADLSAIEARVTAWYAKEKWRLDVFKTHGKIYEASAAMMFNVPIDEVTKGSEYRTKGKIAELALGYQGGVGAMKTMGGEAMGWTEAYMKEIVTLWRAKNPNIKALWHTLERCAKEAVKGKKAVFTHGLAFGYDSNYLKVRLPSGRMLMYHKPTFYKNQFGRDSIKYLGVDGNTKKWGWQYLYGGLLLENIVQATARDVLAESILALDDKLNLVFHVHDEIIADEPKDKAEESLKTMINVMSTEIEWAKGLPLAAEGYISDYYKKD